ncbi:MAG TPA: lipopolysaccharide biosynthesis protein [Kiritimatiellia bacterium]|nr:lipopolysaccharide biosynthesis protein [Kiritimatiellia bacterium]HRZ13006.1 lipopolysaccharide biosynthesis protein [Kiritimatiellia bacterium]HSA18384.1 lipopolysaccharide biosynthesis protein [Kiritimatiellia bacterium]
MLNPEQEENPPSLRRREVSRATRGVVAVTAGQVVSIAISLALALVIPRLLGARDFGNWALFRSVIDFIALLCALGTPAVMSQYYVGARAAGREEEAGLIFKSVAATRFIVAVLAATAGGLLLLASRNPLMTGAAAGFLALSVLARVAGLAPFLLLYAERRAGRIVCINVAQALLVPVAVAGAYVAGGFRWVPPACAVGDLALAGLNWVVAWPDVRWPRGWLTRARFRELASFGIMLALAHTSAMAYITMAPYFMSLAGMSSVLIGRVGLAVRLQNVLLGLLGTAGGALWPSITILMETEGVRRSVVWQSLFSRLGGVLILAAAGVFMTVAGWAVPFVLGKDFTPAIPVISLWLLMTLFFWLGMRYALFGQLMKSPGRVLKASLWMFAVFIPLFLLFGRTGSGVETVWALLAGTLVYALYLAITTRRKWGISLDSIRLLLPLAVTAGLAVYAIRAGPGGLGWPAPAAWLVVFVASVFVSRSLRVHELTGIISSLRRPGLGGGA